MQRSFRALTVVAVVVCSAVAVAAVAPAAADGDAQLGLAGPIGILVRSGGAIYGISAAGGNACLKDLYVPNDRTPNRAGCGAILRYEPDGHVTIVHAFVPKEGARPITLRAGTGGMLFGVTTLGGAYGRGTSFRFDPKTSVLDVLQSFTGDAGSGPGQAPDAAAAYDDGAVLGEDATAGNFSLLDNGKLARPVWHVPKNTSAGPFTLGPDGRAIFTTLPPGACYVGINSLERSGAIHVIATPGPNPTGCAPELASNLNLRVDDDGTVVTSNDTQVIAGKAQSPLAVIYTVPSPPPGLFFNSADVQPDGDILAGTTHGSDCGGVGRISNGVLTELGTFADTPICTTAFLAVEDTTGGVVGLGVVPDSNNHVVPFGIPAGGKPIVNDVFDEYPPGVEDLALRQSIQLARTTGGKIDIAWRVDGAVAMPDFSIAPASFDVELRNVTRAGAPFLRLRPASAKAGRSARVTMTMDSSLSATVPLVVPPLEPGQYEIIERGAAAIHAPGKGLGILDDGAPSYMLVTAYDLSKGAKDTELAKLRKTYSGRSATVARDLPLACDSTAATATRGSHIHVIAASRDREYPAITGFGPLGLHAVASGNIATADAPFYALEPITLTFDAIGDCTNASAKFSSLGDVERYLRP